MATKPKKYTYQIQYTDNTYRMVDWTKGEWDLVSGAMYEEKRVIMLDEAVFVLTDVRTIVNIPMEEPEETKEETEQPKDGQMTEWGFVTAEEAESLREMGIDLGKVSK